MIVTIRRGKFDIKLQEIIEPNLNTGAGLVMSYRQETRTRDRT